MFFGDACSCEHRGCALSTVLLGELLGLALIVQCVRGLLGAMVLN